MDAAGVLGCVPDYFDHFMLTEAEFLMCLAPRYAAFVCYDIFEAGYGL